MKKSLLTWVVACIVIMVAIPVMADKSSVEVDAPDSAKKGDVITIVVKVIHDGNNFLHHTDWVYVRVNGEQIAKWEYSWNDLPENEIFVREVTYPVNGPVNIEVKANCNLHGSKGAVTKTVKVE
mgnify:CR=1 FL=1